MDMDKTCLDFFDNFLGSIRDPLIILDADLKVVKANRAFYNIFAAKPEETEGKIIYELGNHQWDIPKLRELLETILPQNTIFNDFEVEHVFENIGLKSMHLNARRIYDQKNTPRLILLSFQDVTDSEYYKRYLEEIVAKRTSDLKIAQEKAEASRHIAETAPYDDGWPGYDEPVFDF